MPVRLLKNGGSPVVKAEDGAKNKDEKDPNLLDIGGAQLDRDMFINHWRDQDNAIGYFDKKEGYNSRRLRDKVYIRAKQMANDLLNGKMSLNGISTFTHNNPAYVSDGKLKKRPLRPVYNWKDENTVNALAAAMVLDSMQGNKYVVKPKEETPVEGDTNGDGKVDDNDKSELDYSYAGYLTNRFGENYGKNINALIESRKLPERYEFIAQQMQGYYDWLNENLNSGKYRDSDIARRERDALGKLIQTGAFNDEASYLANRNIIDSSLAVAPNIAYWLAGSYTKDDGEGEKDDLDSQIAETQKGLANIDKNLQLSKSKDTLNDYQALLKIGSEEVLPFINGIYAENYAGNPNAYAIRAADPNTFRNKEFLEWLGAYGYNNQGQDKVLGAYRNIENLLLGFIDQRAKNDGMNAQFLDSRNDAYTKDAVNRLRSVIGDNGEAKDFMYDLTPYDLFSSLAYLRNHLYSYLPDEDKKKYGQRIAFDDEGYGASYFDTNKGDFVYTDLKSLLTNGLSSTADIAAAKLRRAMSNSQLIGDYDKEYFNDDKLREIWNYLTTTHVPKGQTGLRMLMSDPAYMQTQPVVQQEQPTGNEQGQWSNDPFINEIGKRIESDNKQRANAQAQAEMAGRGLINDTFGAGNYNQEHAAELFDSMDWKDWARIGSFVTNLGSALFSGSGVGSIAGAATGLVGTLASSTADFFDEDVSRGDAWKNLFMNLGMDALSLVPFLGAAGGVGKLVKAAKQLYPWLSAGLTVMGAKDALVSLDRVKDGNGTNQDWVNLFNALSALSKGGKNIKLNKYNRMSKDAIAMGKLSDKNHVVQLTDKNGRRRFMRMSDKEYKELADAGQTNVGKRISANEAQILQQRRFQDMYGDEYRLTGPVLRKDGRFGFGDKKVGSKSYHRSPYEIDEEYMRDTYGGKALDTFNKRKITLNRRKYGSEVDGLKVRKGYIWQNRDLKERGILGGMWKSAEKRVGEHIDQRRSKKNSTEIKTGVAELPTQGRDLIKREIIDGKPVYSYTKNGTQVTNKSEKDTLEDLKSLGVTKDMLDKLDYMKRGGIIQVGRFANGGKVFKWQNGNSVRNVTVADAYKSEVTPDYAGYLLSYGDTTGREIIEALNALKNIRDTQGEEAFVKARADFMKNRNALQDSYKSMIDATGFGWGKSNLQRNKIAGSHQDLFNKTTGLANTYIGQYSGLQGRGGTTDNAKNNWAADLLNGSQTALRTEGFSTDETDAAFRANKSIQDIMALSKELGMNYDKLAISGGGDNYYGWSLTPEKPQVKFTPYKPTAEDHKMALEELRGSKKPETRMAPGRIGGDKGPLDTEAALVDDKNEVTNFGAHLAGFMNDLIDPVVSTMVNNKATDKMKKAIKPTLATAFRTQSPVENDYFAERTAHDNAARMSLMGNQIARGTANAELGAAAQLAATEKGQDMISQGNAVSAKRFYDTRNIAQQHENANAERWTAVANANRAQMNQANYLRTKLDADRMLHNWNGIWQPWLKEKKVDAMQIAQDKYNQYTANRLYDLRMQRAQELRTKGGATDDEQLKWLNSPEGKKWDLEWGKKMIPDKTVRDFYEGWSVFAKKGTKVKSSYAYNMGLDEYTKEFFKNWRFKQGEDTKERIASSAGALNYVKHLSDHINKTNRMMTYAKPKNYK